MNAFISNHYADPITKTLDALFRKMELKFELRLSNISYPKPTIKIDYLPPSQSNNPFWFTLFIHNDNKVTGECYGQRLNDLCLQATFHFPLCQPERIQKAVKDYLLLSIDKEPEI